MSKSYRNKNAGFTLLEMIVSMGIFTIVAVIAVGSLVRITSLNRQAQSMQAAINNINYILESMSREMRVGSDFQCYRGNSDSFANPSPVAESCPDENGNKAIIFHSSKITSTGCNWVYAYWFINNGGSWSIKKSQQSDLNCSEPVTLGSALQMVDTGNVTVTDVKFNTVLDNTHKHSRFDIRLIGYAGAKEKERNYFDVRTSVSQRIAD